MSLGTSGPGVRSRFLETPRTPCGGVFLASAQTAFQSAVPGASTPRGWRRSEAVDVDRGQLLGRRLKDVPLIMDLHELAPVGRRATSGRHWRRFERFAEVCQDLTSRGRSHPGLRPLANLSLRVSRLLPAVSSEADVTATRWARKRKFLPHPCHQFRPGFCATCHASGAFGSRESRRNGLLWRDRHPHARRLWRRVACRRCRSPAP